VVFNKLLAFENLLAFPPRQHIIASARQLVALRRSLNHIKRENPRFSADFETISERYVFCLTRRNGFTCQMWLNR